MDCNAPTDRSHLIYSKILEDEEEPLPTFPSRTLPLVQLEVQLQNGNKVYISPQPNDHPFELASRFCHQHSLDNSMVPLLAQNIQKSIQYSQESITELQSRTVNPTQIMISEPCPPMTNDKSKCFPLSSLVSKKSSLNSHVSLYDKGRIFTEHHRLWIQRQRDQKRKEEAEQCTYIPKINKMSRSLVSERSLSKLDFKEMPLTKAKHCCEPLKSEKMSRCISSSVILSDFSSRQGMSCELKTKDLNRQSDSSVFEQLYQNKRYQPKKCLESQPQKKHPVINSISREIVGNTNFEERMAKYQKDSLQKKQKLKASQQKQNVYRPKTGPAPANRNVEHLPIGDFLYKNRKKKAAVIVKPPPVPVISRTSRKLYEQRKELAFKEIFEHLTHSGEESVSWDRLNFKEIDPSIMPILFPLLEEIQIMQIELNQDDFLTAINFLFNTLSPNQKNTILNFHHDTSPTESASPLPVMNRKSQQIVKETNRASMKIYDYCELKGSQKEEQLEQRRVQREREQMKECTFQPKVQKKPLYF